MPVAIVPEGLADLRADAGAARLFGISRTRVEQAAERQCLLIDGVPVSKSERLRPGALLEVLIEEPRAVQVRPSLVEGMTIVHDDADIVVVDKPAGVAAHPSLGWDGPSVVEHLAAAGFPMCDAGPPEQKGIVSRLDVGTSGLMVVAKSDLAYSVLKQAFRDREVHKVYHAVVQGYPDPAEGTINAPIGHAKSNDWKMAIDPAGRVAITHYHTQEALFQATLVRVELETGRTHQIRVHMSAVRHPCVGDLLYGADPVLTARVGLSRQWLHAVELGFIHPRSGDEVVFTSRYPDDLQESLDILRRG
ncbi:MAG: RluA family pseudouridine synthase [Propionibacteriaceae bacterium]|nr:RluA family pseudouridine synthase [Propionibacteriaceae bacterium]